MIKRFFIFLINIYRKGISPHTLQSCRYTPTCSEYAIVAIGKHGAFKGLFMSIWRILRCNPFSKGGYDPVK